MSRRLAGILLPRCAAAETLRPQSLVWQGDNSSKISAFIYELCVGGKSRQFCGSNSLSLMPVRNPITALIFSGKIGCTINFNRSDCCCIVISFLATTWLVCVMLSRKSRERLERNLIPALDFDFLGPPLLLRSARLSMLLTLPDKRNISIPLTNNHFFFFFFFFISDSNQKQIWPRFEKKKHA